MKRAACEGGFFLTEKETWKQLQQLVGTLPFAFNEI
jgi:hypothetical protein